jgi:hypothetical protein
MHGPVIRRGRLGVRSGEQRGRAEEQMQYLGGGLSSPVARSPPSKNSSTQNRESFIPSIFLVQTTGHSL